MSADGTAEPARVQEQVCGEHGQRQEHGVKHEESVGAPDPDERRGEQRVDVALAVVQAACVRVGRRREAHERERAAQHQVRVAASLLEEHAERAARELVPHAREILAAVGHVEVFGEAVPEHVVAGLVALEPERRARERPSRAATAPNSTSTKPATSTPRPKFTCGGAAARRRLARSTGGITPRLRPSETRGPAAGCRGASSAATPAWSSV